MINVCLIGVSGFGAVHYADVIRQASAGRMKVLGVCVINQDEEAEKCQTLRDLGAQIYQDYEVMLKEHAGNCDLCLIPTGIPLHRPMTVTALATGANVFVEKPAAGIIDDVDAMMAAESENPGFVAVGYQSMYNQAVHALKHDLLDGVIGAVKEVRCLCLGPRADDYYARNNWAGTLRVGDTWVLDSPFTNAFSHFINLSLFLPGTSFEQSVEPTMMNVELYRANKIESCDSASFSIETAEGVQVRFFTSHASTKHEPQTFKIIGETGYCEWAYNYDKADIRVYKNDGSLIKTIEYAYSKDRDDIQERLQQRVADPKCFVCTLDVARVPVLVSNAAFMATPIVTIADEFITRKENDNGQIHTIVAGMHEAMWKAFEDGCQVSTLGQPWAQAGNDIDISAIEKFTNPA